MGVSNNITAVLNFIAMLSSIPIIASGIWLASNPDNQCITNFRWPIVIIGLLILLVSLAGFVGAYWNKQGLLALYLFSMALLIALLLILLVFAFVVTRPDGSYDVPGRGYKEYTLDRFSSWLRNHVTGSGSWRKIRPCLAASDVCINLARNYITPDQFFNSHLSPLQTKYIEDLLERENMSEANALPTPMISSSKLSKFGGTCMNDPFLYRSIVGALQYATITRPDISFAVNKVCQFLSQPHDEHWKAVKRILRFLKGTIHHGLLFKPFSLDRPVALHAYCDADWGSDPDDRRSTSGSCVFFGPNLVSWSAKKQTLVARSSTEAEYRSLANIAAEILWIQSLLTELHIPFQTPTIFCDNLSTVALTLNPVLHTRTKHMEMDLFFVREKVLNKTLIVQHVPSLLQKADIFTKALSSERFHELKDKLNVVDKFSFVKPP